MGKRMRMGLVLIQVPWVWWLCLSISAVDNATPFTRAGFARV